MNAAAKPDILSASEMRVDDLQHAALDTMTRRGWEAATLKNRVLFITLVGVALSAVIVSSLVGCGGSTTAVKYDTAPDKPVVVLTGYKAIAPEYNPGAPETIVYGNGLIVQKKDPYSYIAGMAAGTQVASILKKLQDQGYFDLNSDYASKQPVEGGTTTVLTVYATSKTHEVKVEAGAQPPGWDAIVKTVQGARAPNMHVYNPSKIRLYATQVTSVPGSAKVYEWPALSDDLQNAAAAGSKGYTLEMEEAISDWTTIGNAFEKGSLQEAYWKTNDGKVYSSVYAYPVFPGLPVGR